MWVAISRAPIGLTSSANLQRPADNKLDAEFGNSSDASKHTYKDMQNENGLLTGDCRQSLLVFHFHRNFPGESARPGNRPLTPLLCALSAALISLSCGSSHAILQINTPPSVIAGTPFSATVTALYQGQRDTIINGPIHFTTTDTAAHLPTLYVFTAADAGSHTFELTLVTPGPQTITVSDYDATPIAGSANIKVVAGGTALKDGAARTETAQNLVVSPEVDNRSRATGAGAVHLSRLETAQVPAY